MASPGGITALQRHQVVGLLQRYCKKGATLERDDDILSYVLSVFCDEEVAEAEADDIFFAIFEELSRLEEDEKSVVKEAIRLIAKNKVPPNYSIQSLLGELAEGGAETDKKTQAEKEEETPIVPGFKFDDQYYLCSPAMPPPPPEMAPASTTPSILAKARSDSVSSSGGGGGGNRNSSKNNNDNSSSRRAEPPAPRELEALYELLEVRGIARGDTQLDAAVLEYVVDVELTAAADADAGTEADADADAGAGASAELLLQFIPGLEGCDPSALAAVLAHVRALAAAKAQSQQQASAEARRCSASAAGQVYTSILEGIARDGSGAGGGGWEDGLADPRDAPLVARLMGQIEDEHPDLLFYADEAVVGFVFAHLAHRHADETLSYLLHNCATDEGRQRVDGLMESHARRAAEDEERKRAALRSVVERYEDVEVRPKYDAKGVLLDKKLEKKELVVFVNKAASDGKHTRYRDGVAVVTNGAKFIVEKDPKEDYDGGSRGKVKSKGKRGKGWY